MSKSCTNRLNSKMSMAKVKWKGIKEKEERKIHERDKAFSSSLSEVHKQIEIREEIKFRFSKCGSLNAMLLLFHGY